MRRPEYWSWILSAASQGSVENGNGNEEPSPYILASSFYGPGVILSWYFICISFLIKFIMDVDNPHRHRLRLQGRSSGNIRFSPDFFATLLYPAIAGGHLLVLLKRFPVQQQEREKLMVMLIDMVLSTGAPPPSSPATGADGQNNNNNAKFSSWGAHGATAAATPPSIEAVQHAIAVEGPVRVLQNFLFVSATLLTAVCLRDGSLKSVAWLWCRGRWWRHTGPAGWLWFAVYWWSCLAMLILIAVGGVGSFVIPYFFLILVGQVVVLYGLVVIAIGGCALPYFAITSLAHGEFAGLVGFVMIAAIAFQLLQYMPDMLSVFIVPDTGVSLWELDQIATAVGGLAGLVITALRETPEGQKVVQKVKNWWEVNVTERKRSRGTQSRTSPRLETLPLQLVRDPEQGQLGRVNTV